MLKNLSIGILLSLITPVILIIIQLLSPHKSSTKELGSRLYSKDEIKKYNRYEAFGLLFMAVIWGAICYIVFLMGEQAYHDLYANVEDPIILPSPYLYCFIGLFFGFGLLPYILTPIYKNMLRDEYDFFNDYLGKKHNIYSAKVWRFITIVSLIAGTLFFFFGLDYSVSLNKQRESILIKDFFSLETNERKLSDIKSIYFFTHKRTMKGDLTTSPHFVLNFANGDYWSSEYLTNEDNLASTTNFLNVLKVETHLPIVHQTSPGQ